MEHKLLKYSDGGLEQTKLKNVETNDCTVRALAILAKVPYDAAHKLLKQGGRVDRKGFYMSQYLDMNPVAYGYKFEKVKFSDRRNMGHTLRQFATNNPKGSYMILTRDHATSIVDGKYVDTFIKPKSRVEVVYEVKPTSKQMPVIKAISKPAPVKDQSYIGINTKVEIHGVSPNYLNGKEGTVVQVRRKIAKIILKDGAIGRFTTGVVDVRLSCLVVV